MATNTTSNNSARQTHVSPGIYTKEVDLTYASKSLGITTLGLAGETLKGAAFQPMLLENWREYQTFFGDTSTEKFSGSQYPKYELPYIAKEYLTQSDQLYVCRVLGLSGVNAGAAWIISAYSDEDKGDLGYTEDKPVVIAVLRSRGEHKKAAFVREADPSEGICDDVYEYDKILYYATKVGIKKSKTLSLNDDCSPGYSTTTNALTIDSSNYGTFTLEVTTYEDETKNYSVTLNPGDKNYILNVLGTDPQNGDSEIYVEELYDVALQQLIERGEIDTLAKVSSDDTATDLACYPVAKIIPAHAEVTDLLSYDESTLARKDVGKRYLYSTSVSVNAETGEALKVHVSTDNGTTWTPYEGIVGHIYTVVAYTTTEGTREYYYGEYAEEIEPVGDSYRVVKVSDTKNKKTEYLSADSTVGTATNNGYEGMPESGLVITDGIFQDAVEVLADDMYYVLRNGEETSEVVPITLDLNNYKEKYREAVTPWIVSELKGSAEHVELTKLFRFHTISDGDNSNVEVKISIERIDPDEGTFNVVVRDFYDTDGSQTILERFSQCNMVPGSSNYIGLKIGTTNGDYESKSNYITVEVIENDKTKVSVPAGFLGYPVRCYETGTCVMPEGYDIPSLSKPYLQYNTNVDDDIRVNRQYFGMSDLMGIDEDILKYKGMEAYNDMPSGLSPCFHLDSRIFEGVPDSNGVVTQDGIPQTVSVDGTLGYQWVTVGKGNTTQAGIEPRIGDEATMYDTIYEDIRYRKFTVALYGGWDGWDYYRTSRSNADDYQYTKYRGNFNYASGEGSSFSVLRDPELYGFEEGTKALNSDFYAYLSAIRQFANPKQIDINVLATPGIDLVNQNALVGEVIDMVENERADSVYVITMPDKPFGAGDTEGEMYTPSEAVYNLEDSDIDSNYSCTYYPWCHYFDQTNNQYIWLPLTKDIVRNFAYTDNKQYPWFPAAGWNRGDINAVRAKRNLTLSDQDTLYEGRINFVNNFAQDGMKIWGDKNLQVLESQMNRISKRRLLIRIKKLLSIACIGLIFDPNDATTAESFKSAVKPILEDIVAKRGLVDFAIEVDDSQEARDRLELPAKIYLQLQPNLEYIDISFIITPQGASFDNV